MKTKTLAVLRLHGERGRMRLKRSGELTARRAAAARLVVLKVTAAMTQLFWDGAHWRHKQSFHREHRFGNKADAIVAEQRHVGTYPHPVVRESRAVNFQWRGACRWFEGHLQSWGTLSPLLETP